ncbi:MAG: hypothetical protein K0S65_4038, partial [Labilithrix sp.]|nr:hypothetical protein [Labilithrix sp.]
IFRGALESLSAAEVRDLVKILGKVARRVQQTVRRETAETKAEAGGESQKGR